MSTRWLVGRKFVARTMGPPTGLRPERSSTANSPGFTHCFCGSLGAAVGGVSVATAGSAGFRAEGAVWCWSGVAVCTAGAGALGFGGCCCAFVGAQSTQPASATAQAARIVVLGILPPGRSAFAAIYSWLQRARKPTSSAEGDCPLLCETIGATLRKGDLIGRKMALSRFSAPLNESPSSSP